MNAAKPSPASALVQRHLDDLRSAAQRGPVVDVACGRGRNALAMARSGIPVVGIDRNATFLETLAESARRERLPIRLIRADLERDLLPLAPGRCGAIAVFRYLHRPLCPQLAEALGPGGLLLYETFTLRQRELGHGPGNESFLLRDGELPKLFPELRILHHWEGTLEGARPTAVAQLVARRSA